MDTPTRLLREPAGTPAHGENMVHGFDLPCSEDGIDPAAQHPSFHPKWPAHEADPNGILLHVQEEVLYVLIM